MIDDRKKIRAYFMAFSAKKLLVIIIVSYLAAHIVSIATRLLLGFYSTILFLLIFIAPFLIYLVRYILLKDFACSDKEYDERLKSDIEKTKNLLFDKLQVEEEDILNRYEILSVLVYKDKNSLKRMFLKQLSVPFILSKKGLDGKYRETPFIYSLIVCLEDKLIVAGTTFDMITGNLLDTNIYNIYFNEITTYYFKNDTYKSIVKTTLFNNLKNIIFKTPETNIDHRLKGNILQENLFSTFIIESRGGTKIKIQLPETKFIENVADHEPYKSEAIDTINAVHKMIDDKKTT